MNAIATQQVGYATSGYVRVFASDEGEALIEANSAAVESLLHAKDPELWKTHLGAEGGFKAFLEKGEPVETADYITPAEAELQGKIIRGSWYGVLNWYKAGVRLPVHDSDKNLTEEQRKVDVPAVVVITEKDYAIMAEMQAYMTQKAAGDLLRVERLPTAHWAMLEAKDKIEELLEAFGEQVGGPH